jgi:phenylacetate-CoA ligase
LNGAGRRLLERLLEHPAAPRYNFACGDQLDGPTWERARVYEAGLYTTPRQRGAGAMATPLQEFVARCTETVPFYRRQAGMDFSLQRSDIQAAPWSLVPDDEPLEPMMVYETSGTMGSKLWVLSHPFVSAAYLAILRHALEGCGVRLEGGPDRVAIAMVSHQRETLTYATVSTFLDQAGFVKLNLNPDDWQNPTDRVAFLHDCDAEIYTGNPVSFAELARLPVTRRPKALVSSSMALLPGLKAELEARFGCPVIDVYSMCECRAISTGQVMRPDVHIEILDEENRLCAAGQRGEVVVTSSLNPYLPLIRYRTGDHAAWATVNGAMTLVDLEGRPPVLFLAADGERVNNIDVTIALRDLPVAQLQVVQKADRSLVVAWRGAAAEDALRRALAGRLGDLPMTLSQVEGPWTGKVLQYRSEMSPINF